MNDRVFGKNQQSNWSQSFELIFVLKIMFFLLFVKNLAYFLYFFADKMHFKFSKLDGFKITSLLAHKSC